MPVKKRDSKRRDPEHEYRGKLTPRQYDALLGPGNSFRFLDDADTIAEGFESEADARRAWSDHGERIMREWDQPGRRPLGWWLAAGAEPHAHDAKTMPWPWDGASTRLLELGELSGAEFRNLDERARTNIRTYRDDLQPGMTDALLDFYREHAPAKEGGHAA